MANKVFLNKDGLIEQIYVGKQTFETVIESSSEVMVLGDQLKDKNRKVRVLVNLNKITTVTTNSLLAAADTLNAIPKAKIAIFGGKVFLHKLANLVIAATGRQKTVKLFNTRTLAEKWLKTL